jgi:hypothetical protein
MKERNLFGTCYVGRHVNGARFVLLKFAFDEGLGVHFLIGPIVPILNQEMEKDGLSIVLNQLRNIPILDPKQLSDAEQIPDKDLLKLKRNHVLVSVELLKSDIEEMKMIPLHAGRGSRFDAQAEEVQLFPLPTSNCEFMQHLKEALDIAS